MLAATYMASAVGCTPKPSPAVPTPASEEYCAQMKKEEVVPFGGYVTITDILDGERVDVFQAVIVEPTALRADVVMRTSPNTLDSIITADVSTGFIEPGDYFQGVDVVVNITNAAFVYEGKSYMGRSYAVHLDGVIGNGARVVYGPLQCFKFASEVASS